MTTHTLLNDTLCTNAELRAEAAERLPAFRGFKLLNLKTQLTTLLGLIGRDQIFEQFTRHDITHINKLLGMLDWLIPTRTQEAMTPTDWLMLTLAIYFHDSGMLVTRGEYAKRASSGFPSYVKDVLLVGDAGRDLEAKLSAMTAESRERFYYQEYVRHNHAHRIRAWLRGDNIAELGDAGPVVEELRHLLAGLPETFRRDLGLVCESHHEIDLGDLGKYQVSQPYGDLPDETCNLQYTAVILRTADVLHMTQDRTPSVEFRVIAPTDPISQVEWAKQMAVRTVRSQPARDREGVVDEALPRDTIEVHAHFTEPPGFFGLTAFLAYVQKELRQSCSWVTQAQKEGAAKYEFPWRHIDESHVDTEGFLRQQFEFSLDQARILDLLTGHTIYNDATVVLRELIQNAIDAIRVQEIDALNADGSSFVGAISVRWDSKERVLEVADNGTGMSQDVIERHLLKAGSSKYQEDSFKKRYPSFSPISRFGIGILSCFMIADSVDIVTLAEQGGNEARQLSLRDVHGRYLIRTLDKTKDPVAARLGPHGTLVRLHVRHSVDVGDVAVIVRRWIVVPGCEVTLSVDNGRPTPVGFSSAREALLDELRRFGFADSPDLRVDEIREGGVSVAFALRWSETFKEWSLVDIPQQQRQQGRVPLVGTCVEGIRVEFTTPGYTEPIFFSLANATGTNAPKTNVARSGLEVTPELNAMLRDVYKAYCRRVADEVKQLEEGGFSKTWAAQEAKWLLAPLERAAQARNASLLDEAIAQVPIIIRETAGRRTRVSINDVNGEDEWWATDSEFFRSAESMIREVAGDVSLASVLNAIGAQGDPLPSGVVVCNFRTLLWSYPGELLRREREVDKIVVDTGRRRIDLRWRAARDPSLWVQLPEGFFESNAHYFSGQQYSRAARFMMDYRIGVRPVEVVGLDGATAVRAFNLTYILHGSKLATYLETLVRAVEASPTVRMLRAVAIVFEWCQRCIAHGKRGWDAEDARRRLAGEGIASQLDLRELEAAFGQCEWRAFDASAWQRQENPAD